MEAFADEDGTDPAYLVRHLPRFLDTYQRFDATWDRARGTRLLDIGGHWLHQSVVFALGGYQVTSTDLPDTFERESVRRVAEQHDIRLVTYKDLSAEGVLSEIEDESVNVVLLAEIIEHITFNPIELWKEIYRVITPRGRIIVTTPNYYRLGGYAWQVERLLAGYGGGIPVEQIIKFNTLGHHWKEYSRKELMQYFNLLSPDFNWVRCDYTVGESSRAAALQRAFKWIRQGLHVEVDIPEKKHGITAEPGW